MSAPENKQIEDRLERIEEKLDRYLEATTEVKKDMEWMKGSVKIIITTIISGVGLFLSAVFNNLFGGK
jgi:chromosome segregation ATPase